MRFALVLTLTAALSGQAPPADDPREIIRSSASKDQVNRALRQKYTYIQRNTQKEFDKNGREKSTHSTAHDIVVLYGHPFRRLIEKNGRPLTAKEEQKEKERLEKFTAKWTNENAEQHRKRLEQEEKNRREGVKYLQEITDAYDFRLLPDEKIDGRDTWVIQGEPHPGYRPKMPGAKYFSKIQGKVWVDKSSLEWVKVEAETIDTISYGLVLFRLAKGSRLGFEQTRVNDEIWLPRSAHVTAAARVGVFLRASIDNVTTFENYRKFQTDSNIVGIVPDP